MKPLFIWAGGKNKMLKHYKPFMPKEIDVYCEPFFGGGAMFLHVYKTYCPKKILINDINKNIMKIYISIRDSTEQFKERLDRLSLLYLPLSKEDRKKFFYDLRREHAYDYKKWNEVDEAATLYFLMKTSFNGIFQINKNTNNRFGTPIGLANETTKVYDKNVVDFWHLALQNVEILSDDWRECVKRVNDSNGTFVFLDPPYRGSFTSYGQKFLDEDQEALVDYTKNQKKSLVFLCNRHVDDGFFDSIEGVLLNKFPTTYTAGRRKRTQNGFEAKKAVEILIRNR